MSTSRDGTARDVDALLEVDGLRVVVDDADSPAATVRDVSLSVRRGGTLGIVGESGCGKTMTVTGLLGLLPEYARVTARAVRWAGDDVGLDGLGSRRGEGIGFVPQHPVGALDPLRTVGAHLRESLRLHGAGRREARDRALALLSEVGIEQPRRCERLHPWQLSGGMAQRVVIALALAPEPDLLIADEPTTALDAPTRKRVLGLIDDLRRTRGLSLILISHDLAVVGSQADEIAVMYAGKVVEHGPSAAVSARPRHPYTRALHECVLDPFRRSHARPIPGEPPRSSEVGRSCAFRDRCGVAIDACEEAPELPEEASAGALSRAACWNPVGGPA